jgi:hypothetical protein
MIYPLINQLDPNIQPTNRVIHQTSPPHFPRAPRSLWTVLCHHDAQQVVLSTGLRGFFFTLRRVRSWQVTGEEWVTRPCEHTLTVAKWLLATCDSTPAHKHETAHPVWMYIIHLLFIQSFTFCKFFNFFIQIFFILYQLFNFFHPFKFCKSFNFFIHPFLFYVSHLIFLTI